MADLLHGGNRFLRRRRFGGLLRWRRRMGDGWHLISGLCSEESASSCLSLDYLSVPHPFSLDLLSVLISVGQVRRHGLRGTNCNSRNATGLKSSRCGHTFVLKKPTGMNMRDTRTILHSRAIVKPLVCFNNGFIGCRVRRGAIETDGRMALFSPTIFISLSSAAKTTDAANGRLPPSLPSPDRRAQIKAPSLLPSSALLFPTLALCHVHRPSVRPSVSPATIFPAPPLHSCRRRPDMGSLVAHSFRTSFPSFRSTCHEEVCEEYQL